MILAGVRSARRVALSVLVGLACGSCLPRDTRPVPASLAVSAVGSAPLLGAHGSVLTADGWSVTYDRFLIAIGGASLGGDACTSYYDADYRRVLDMQTPGAQKVGLVYALGACDFGFRVSGPDSDAVLGAGVSAADAALMGTPGSDRYTTNRGVSLYARGSATRGAVRKAFAWEFRQRVGYESCVSTALPPGSSTFELASGEPVTLSIAIHGETLLLDSLDVSRAALRFDAIASADDRYGNHDGEVTLDELGLVPLAAVAGPSKGDAGASGVGPGGDASAADGGASTYRAAPDAGATTFATLEDFVYLGLFPKVARIDGASCVHWNDRTR
jgi:hypothetical protein